MLIACLLLQSCRQQTTCAVIRRQNSALDDGRQQIPPSYSHFKVVLIAGEAVIVGLCSIAAHFSLCCRVTASRFFFFTVVICYSPAAVLLLLLLMLLSVFCVS
jgi:hypothetical protein